MTSRPKHFYALDNLRGLAALLVVIYHWVNFFYVGRSPFHGDPHQLPFYAILRPVYEQGLMAVDLFFCLSGFIFFWLYAQAIAEKKVTFKQFASLRFSRLYPLHFVTLLAAAGATYAIRHLDGSYWGDAGYNDWYHFALQIFFASNWGWEDGVSFNSPIWSVSVEVWLYLLFFSLCRLRLMDWKLVLGYGLMGLLLMQNDSWLVGKGILGFFMGGLAFKCFHRLQTRDLPVRNLVLALGVIWIFFPVNYSMGFAYRAWYHLGIAPDHDLIGQTIRLLTTYSYDLFLFPATLVLLALWETKRGTLGRRLAFLGNISYSSYLLHFPLQLLVIILAIKCGWPKSLFTNPAALLVFLGLVIGVSLASYHWFEKPLQHWLRKKMLSGDRPR